MTPVVCSVSSSLCTARAGFWRETQGKIKINQKFMEILLCFIPEQEAPELSALAVFSQN